VAKTSEGAFEQAKAAVAAENQQQGVNRPDLISQLGIEFARAVYARFPY
jgi:hypothetical protein